MNKLDSIIAKGIQQREALAPNTFVAAKQCSIMHLREAGVSEEGIAALLGLTLPLPVAE